MCYDSEKRPRGYMAQCERKYSWGSAREDFVLPDAHTVTVKLAKEHIEAVGKDKCTWFWQPRISGGKTPR